MSCRPSLPEATTPRTFRSHDSRDSGGTSALCREVSWLLGLAVLLAGTVAGAAAPGEKTPLGNWPQWRGPNANGDALPGSYPVKWSRSENLAWEVKLPGRGASTPIVWDNQIFLTCGVDGQNVLLSYDRAGKLLWQLKHGEERPGKNKKASGANSSCVTDGKLVFAYFKSGDLVAATLDGKPVWAKNLQKEYGEDTLWWDLGTSPVLTRDAVLVACMQTGPSYLAAFSKTSGDVLWKVDRNLDAPSEAAQSYSTPLVVEENGRETIYVLGADHVTAHDAANGQELWRVGGLNPTRHQYFRSIASPVIESGILVAPYARGATLTGVRLGGQGDVSKSHVVWTVDGLGADVPTPAARDGAAYICTDKGEVAGLDVKTGKEIWRGKLPPNRNAYSASPILAGEHLYVTREDGRTFVLKLGTKFELVAENDLGDFTVATPIVMGSQILIRTDEHLFCVGG